MYMSGNSLVIVALIVILSVAYVLLTRKKAGNMLSATVLEAAMKTTVKKAKHGYSVDLTRYDIQPYVDGFKLSPAVELELEVNFMPLDNQKTVVMGELAVLDTEIALIEKIFFENSITITAIHNHFIRETPRVLFIHFLSVGDGQKLAHVLRSLYDQLTSTYKHNDSTQEPKALALDMQAIDRILETSGKVKYNAYKVSIDRPDISIKDHGMPMDADTWFTFQGTNEKAAVAGEIALTVPQVPKFVHSMIAHNIEVVALHNHMITEEPRIIFAHIWGVGPLEKLAQACKVALDTLR